VHVLNQLSLKGVAGIPLYLRSTQVGSPWQIWPDVGLDVQYVDVQDSHNVSDIITQINVAHGTNTGNQNIGWAFLGAQVNLSSSANRALKNAPVTFTANVANNDEVGTMTFKYGLLTIPGCVNIDVVQGTASCPTDMLPVGLNNIVAVFSTGSQSSIDVSSPLNFLVGGSNYFLPVINQ